MGGNAYKARRLGEGGEVRDAILLFLALLFSLVAAWKWMTGDTFEDAAWQSALAQVNERKA